jgi:hypothetical protein
MQNIEAVFGVICSCQNPQADIWVQETTPKISCVTA